MYKTETQSNHRQCLFSSSNHADVQFSEHLFSAYYVTSNVLKVGEINTKVNEVLVLVLKEFVI